MRIGWLDYNKQDRKDFFEAIYNMEKGTNDELGLGSIRDMFSDIFFPGISTIQTRAKYFILLPQILLELNNKNNLSFKSLYEREAKVCEYIRDHTRECGIPTNGIIGIDSLDNIQDVSSNEKELKWVQRAPSEVYWNGLVTLGIVKNVKHLSEYIDLSNVKKNNNLVKCSKYDDDLEERINDSSITYPCITLNLPKIDDNTINITLTKEEKKLLSEIIINTNNQLVSTSLLSYLVGKGEDVLSMKFDQIDDLLIDYEYKRYYDLAVKFRKFSKNLRVFYYILLTKKNEHIIDNDFQKGDITEDELDEIFEIPKKFTQFKPFPTKLKDFLKDSLKCLCDKDYDGLKELIKEREKNVKLSNAKINDGKEYSFPLVSDLFLDYRFDTAKQIIHDIVDKEDYYDKSDGKQK